MDQHTTLGAAPGLALGIVSAGGLKDKGRKRPIKIPRSKKGGPFRDESTKEGAKSISRSGFSRKTERKKRQQTVPGSKKAKNGLGQGP